MYTAYFLEEECGLKATPEQDASSCTIYHMCARNGYQGYIRLSTNLPGVEPNKWVLYHPQTKTYGSDTAAADTSLESNTRRLTRMLLDQHFFANVHVLSEKQGEDAIWRLLRGFEFTSSVTAHMLSFYRRCSIPDEVYQDDSGKVAFSKYFTLLFAQMLTFSDNADDERKRKTAEMKEAFAKLTLVKLKAPARRHKLKSFSTAKKKALVSMLLTRFDAIGGFDDATDDDELEEWPIPGNDRDNFFMKHVWSWFMTQPSEKEWLNSLQVGRRAEPLTMKNLPAFISENSDFEILHDSSGRRGYHQSSDNALVGN